MKKQEKKQGQELVADLYSTYKPLRGFVLLKPVIIEDPEERGESFAAEQFIEQESLAEVVSVGEGVDQVKLQQIIIYPQYGFTPVKIKGEELMVIEEGLILLVTPYTVKLN